METRSTALAGHCAASYKNGNAVVVMGGGLTGLSAAYGLAKSSRNPIVLEASDRVGGLAATLKKGPFLYDIGGHRFHTKDKTIESFVNDLMAGEMIRVKRRSKIYMRGKFFDYPLRPFNAFFGLGPWIVFRSVMDYAIQRIKDAISPKPAVSLEDWVIGKFGRTLFNIYFKEYSEKVWGIHTSRISKNWVSRRIHGLDLSRAVKNALFKFSGKDIQTLADEFTYPRLGIGRMAERLKEEAENNNGKIMTGSRITRVMHENNSIKSVEMESNGQSSLIEADSFISTIPLNHIAAMMCPQAPDHVIDAANKLNFRDLIIVAVEVDREFVTDQTWIYIPERKVPFGRLHEPKRWSADMAPRDKTMLVIEYFCFKGDNIWEKSDGELIKITMDNLSRLGFFDPKEVSGATVHRIERAYPLFEIGYEENCKIIMDYLSKFENLIVAGRTGTFEYLNMDNAIKAGIDAATEAARAKRSP